MSDEFYSLDPKHTDPKRTKREREKARNLRASPWWKQKISEGVCHYCEQKFKSTELTMDHLVPIARGGESTKANLVPACKECNAKKKLHTPVDLLFQQLEAQKKKS
jgi:5-methylcytosine-specific restriction protein A